MAKENDGIIMYGTDWCPDCLRAKLLFKRMSIDYLYINLVKSPEFYDLVEKVNRGNRSVPTIIFPDGSTLTEPSSKELKNKLSNMSK